MTLRLFPTLAGATYPVIKTPSWSTDIQQSVSGKVSALARWTYPIYGIEIPYSVLRTDPAFKEYQELVAFFNNAQGRANPFRFNDPMDNAVTAQLIGIGDGATVNFQLSRTISGYSTTWNDPVFYPTGTPQVFVDGVLKATPADYSISSSGMVTFVTPPAAGKGVTWTGTFDWIVRFGEDSASFEQFNYNMFELKKIMLSTEKI